MRSAQQTVYIAEDGKSFTSEEECKHYEDTVLKRLQRISYFLVRFHADTTEGRGYMGMHVLAVEHVFPHHAALQWCIKHAGNPIQYVQGVSSTPGWDLQVANRSHWDDARSGKLGVRWGGHFSAAGTTFYSDGDHLPDMPGPVRIMPNER